MNTSVISADADRCINKVSLEMSILETIDDKISYLVKHSSYFFIHLDELEKIIEGFISDFKKVDRLSKNELKLIRKLILDLENDSSSKFFIQDLCLQEKAMRDNVFAKDLFSALLDKIRLSHSIAKKDPSAFLQADSLLLKTFLLRAQHFIIDEMRLLEKEIDHLSSLLQN
jgi:hypothetical protein